MKRIHILNEGLIRLPIYDATSMTIGQGLLWGVDASSTSTSALIDVTDTAKDIFAVLGETPANTVTNVGTPVVYQAEVQLVDNPKVWKIDYDMSVANDANVQSYSSPVITVAACDDHLDGSWVYINSGPGIGELRYISAADATTLTANTAFTTTLTSSTDFILIRNVGRPTDGVALDSTFSLIATILNEATSTNMVILKNFTSGGSLGKRELDISLNPFLDGADGLNARGIGFFTHVVFADTAIHAQGIS